MNYDDIVDAMIHGEKIYNLPLRVTYYCRVSTSSDVQLNSLNNQLEYYKNYIKAKPAWTFVDGYIEEGVTGVIVDKRPSFKKMISDAKLNKFDLIITKEVSRFARDLEDSIHYIRILKKYNVGVFFENQNLNTFDSNSELILNIMFNLAQDESKKLSSRVKFGHKQAVLKGHVLGSSNIIGYKKDSCKLSIVPEEAKFVQIVFQLYATGEYGFYKLARELGNLGFYNKKGNLYDKSTLKRIISNPKYKGFYRGHTFEIMDYRTKRRKKVPENEQLIYRCTSDIIPPIVSEELWDKANELLNNRKENYQINNHYSGSLKYPFSSKIYCQEHNISFARSHSNRKNNRPIWSCSLYLQYRLEACNSPIIAEIDLYNILLHIMNSIMPGKNKIIEDMILIYKSIGKVNKYDSELKIIDEYIKNIESKKTMTLDLVYKAELRIDELKVQFEQFEKDIKALNQKREKVIEQMNLLSQSKENIEKMTKYIQDELDGGSLEGFIRKFVDEIIVSKIDDDRYNIKLDIYLNLHCNELPKIKGARHVNGATINDIPYMLNQECTSIENLRKDRKLNKFTYNVYVESLL